MRRVTFILALICLSLASDAYARGGRGNAGVSLALAAVIGLAAIVYFVQRSYPDFFPTVGGVLVWLVVGSLLTSFLVYVGLVPREYFALTTVALTAGIIASLIFPGMWRRAKERRAADRGQ